MDNGVALGCSIIYKKMKRLFLPLIAAIIFTTEVNAGLPTNKETFI